jgi:hypothetical protein
MNNSSFKNALFTNNIAQVERCLNAGQDVNATFNPLNFAIRASASCYFRGGYGTPCPLGVIELLLDRNADMENSNGNSGVMNLQMTPLLTAASSGSVDIVNLLIARGVNVCRRDAHGETALHVLETMCEQQPEHKERFDDVVEILRNEMNRVWTEIENRNIALAMGQHNRLGALSRLSPIEVGVLQMIARRARTDSWR